MSLATIINSAKLAMKDQNNADNGNFDTWNAGLPTSWTVSTSGTGAAANSVRMFCSLRRTARLRRNVRGLRPSPPKFQERSRHWK